MQQKRDKKTGRFLPRKKKKPFKVPSSTGNSRLNPQKIVSKLNEILKKKNF